LRVQAVGDAGAILGRLGRDRQPGEVGPDRQLAMAAVDQDDQADLRGPAEVADRVEGGSDGPAGVEDVVDEDDLRAVDGEGDLGPAEHGPAVAVAEVIAVERDVERPDGHRAADEALQPRGDPLGDRHAPGPDADEADRHAGPTPPGDPPRQVIQGRLEAGGVADEQFGRSHRRPRELRRQVRAGSYHRRRRPAIDEAIGLAAGFRPYPPGKLGRGLCCLGRLW